jgi:hypothetical protein
MHPPPTTMFKSSLLWKNSRNLSKNVEFHVEFKSAENFVKMLKKSY